MSDALLIGNFQADYCLEFEGTCPYLGAFLILPGYRGLDNAVCRGCIMSMSCVRIYYAYNLMKFWETQNHD